MNTLHRGFITDVEGSSILLPRWGWGDSSDSETVPTDHRANPTVIKPDMPVLSEAVPYRYTVMFLGVIGGMPFTWEAPHVPSLHPTKSTLPLALVIYSCMSYSMYGFFFVIGGRFRQGESAEVQVLAIEVAVASLYHFVTLSVWSDVPLTTRDIYLWLELGTFYRTIMGRKMPIRWRIGERVMIALIIVIPAAAYAMARVGPYVWAVGFVYNNTVTGAICSLWIGHFASLERFAKEINNKLKDEFRNNLLTPQRLRQYRETWLAMRTLSDVMSSFNAPILICVLHVILIVFFIYSSLLLSQTGNPLFAAAHVALSALLLTLLFGMCRKSQNAIDEIKIFYSDIVAIESMQGLLHHQLTKEVVNLYLIDKARPPLPSFGGFVLVNKTLLFKLLATILTHLVILFQIFPRLAGPKP